MEIVFLRHGKTELNKKSCYLGSTDDGLSEEGMEEIRAIKDKLKVFDFDKVYTSPLKRAVQSCEILYKNYVIDNRVREINFGLFDGLTNLEVQNRYPREYSNWIEDYINYKIPNGESLKELFDRTEEFINDISSKYKRVLVVTHGGVIRCALSLAFDSRDFFYKFQVDHGSVNILSIEEGFKYIKGLNLQIMEGIK